MKKVILKTQAGFTLIGYRPKWCKQSYIKTTIIIGEHKIKQKILYDLHLTKDNKELIASINGGEQ